MPTFLRHMIAVVAALTVLFASLGIPAEAQATAILAGRVTGADGTSPRPDVVVHLVSSDARESVASATTDRRGSFRMESAPAGTYRVLVETTEGAFLAPDPLSLRAGEESAPVLLALRQQGPDDAPGTEPTPGTPPPAAKEGLPTWAKWTIVGVVGVAGGLVIKEITDEDEASDL